MQDQDRLIDGLLTRLSRMEALVSDVYQLVAALPAPAACPPCPAAPVCQPVPACPAPAPAPAPAAAPLPAATPPTPPVATPVATKPPHRPAPRIEEDEEEPGFAALLVQWAPQLGGGMLILLLMFWWSRQRAARSQRVRPAAPPSPRAAAPPPAPQALPVSAPAPAAAPQSLPAVDLLLERESAEGDQAVELADIMLSMGLSHGAAGTLASQVASAPKQALRPWLKLLDIYRQNNQQAEFERTVDELRRNFNVHAKSWDATAEAAIGIEDYPHIALRIAELWGTRACLVYLHNLLADNRDGSRAGFPQSVAEEILLLSTILEMRGTPT